MLTLMWTTLLTAAHAVPAIAPSDYDGTYDLWCNSTTLTLNLGVGVAGPTGAAGWQEDYAIPLPCAVPPRQVVAYARGVEADCRATGLPRQACRDYAWGVYQILLPFADVGDALIPTGAELRVDPNGLFDLHNLFLDYLWADGSWSSGQLLLDNNAGANAGHVVGFGLTLGGSSVGDAGCLVPVVASVDGYIDPTTFDIDAIYQFSGQTWCAGVLPGGWGWSLALGLSGAVDVGGARLLP